MSNGRIGRAVKRAGGGPETFRHLLVKRVAFATYVD